MAESSFYTGRGDDGCTGLLGPERVPKFDPRPEAYGTVDEAQAALGLARASGCTPRTGTLLLEVERELYVLMAELAAIGDPDSPFGGSISQTHVARLEGWIAELETDLEMPREFVIPGDSQAGAALHLARTIVRRAERIVARLHHGEHLENGQVLRYLNRLSSLLFGLACFEDRAVTDRDPTKSRAE
jgi:cob(I)alamin adenosyltransferase